MFMEMILPASRVEKIGFCTYALTMVGLMFATINPMPAKKARPKPEEKKLSCFIFMPEVTIDIG